MNEQKEKPAQLSITIPKELDEKLDMFQSAISAPKNKSALISKILHDFFKDENYMKNTIEFHCNTMLVPLNLYKEVEGISQMAVNSRIKKNKIKVEKIGNNDFVLVDEQSIKNIYLQTAQLQRTIKSYGIQLIGFKNELEDLRKKISIKEQLKQITKDMIND